MPSETHVDVYVVRYLDGHRIEHQYTRLTHGEADFLYWEQTCLPGELRVFDKTPSLRHWESPADP